jgi:hypothetical protein
MPHPRQVFSDQALFGKFFPLSNPSLFLSSDKHSAIDI